MSEPYKQPVARILRIAMSGDRCLITIELENTFSRPLAPASLCRQNDPKIILIELHRLIGLNGNQATFDAPRPAIPDLNIGDTAIFQVLENKTTADNWPEHRKLAGVLAIVLAVICIAIAALWAIYAGRNPGTKGAGLWVIPFMLGLAYVPMGIGVIEGKILFMRIVFAINTLMILVFLYFAITEHLALFIGPLGPITVLMWTIEILLARIFMPLKYGNT